MNAYEWSYLPICFPCMEDVTQAVRFLANRIGSEVVYNSYREIIDEEAAAITGRI